MYLSSFTTNFSFHHLHCLFTYLMAFIKLTIHHLSNKHLCLLTFYQLVFYGTTILPNY